MNEHVHAEATRFALEMLPQTRQHTLAPVAGKLVSLYSLYPDIYKWKAAGSTHDNAVLYGHIPLEETGPYALLADGSDPDWSSVTGVRNAIDFYMHAMVVAWRDGCLDEFAKFAGSYSHYLMDAVGLAHVGPAEKVVPRLIPPPRESEFTCLSYHGALEFIAFDPERPAEHALRLMGADLQQSVFFLSERWLQAMAEVMRQHIPSVQALFRKDLVDVLRRQNLLIAMGVQILADTLHTAITLAEGNGSGESAAGPVPLGDILACETPDCDTMYRGQFVRNRSVSEVVDLGWKKVALELFLPDGDQLARRTIDHGLGFGAPTNAVFHLHGIFASLEADMGLHARLGVEGSGRVRLLGDGRELYDSGTMRGNEPARHLSINLKDVHRFDLKAEAAEKRDGFSGLTTCDHLVLGNPMLSCA